MLESFLRAYGVAVLDLTQDGNAIKEIINKENKF